MPSEKQSGMGQSGPARKREKCCTQQNDRNIKKEGDQFKK